MSALVAVSTEEVVLHTHPPPHSVLLRGLWPHGHYLSAAGTYRGVDMQSPTKIINDQLDEVSAYLSHHLVAGGERDFGDGLRNCRS